MESVWRVSFAGEETYRPPYGFDNRGRAVEARAIIQYGLSGEIDWHDAAGHRRVPPHHAMLFTLDEASRFGLDPGNLGPYRCAWFSLAGAGIDVLWRSLVSRHGATIGPDSDGRLLAAMRRLRRSTGQRAVHEFVADLCDWLEERRDAGLRPVERAAEQLAAEPYRDWSVKRLAASCRVSRERLSEVFRDRFGEAPGAWLLQRRLAFARELLRDSGMPVQEVARRCGLGTGRRLSRALRRNDGVPAGRLRTAGP